MKYDDTVNLSFLEPAKREIIEKMRETFCNCLAAGVLLQQESIGEPAALFELPGCAYYLAFKMDGVGTKSVIADKMAIARKKVYTGLGQDLVAMNVNDLLCVGAIPFALANEIGMGSTSYIENGERITQLLEGLVTAAEKGMVTIACGETAVLPDVVLPDHASITGASLGLAPKEWVHFGEKICGGDLIYGLPSSGIHSNGLSLARRIAESLPDGYHTSFQGKTLGEELLIPTKIYCDDVLPLFQHGVDIHYMTNITGSGWKKIMRAKHNWTYVITHVPQPQPIFSFLQEKGNVSDEEAYQTWNMGIGMVIVAPENEKKKLEQIAHACVLGHVEQGEKRVVIPPKKIVYSP